MGSEMKPEDLNLVRRASHSTADALARHGYYYGTLGDHFFSHLIEAARAEGRAERLSLPVGEEVEGFLNTLRRSASGFGSAGLARANCALAADALLALSRGYGDQDSVALPLSLGASRDDGRSEATPSEGGET